MIEDERSAGDTRDSGTRMGRLLAGRMGIASPEPHRRSRGFSAAPDSGRAPNFITLWIVVSGLWTIATCLRIQRTWGGWPAAAGNPYTWVSLLLPPVIFALLLIGVSRVAQRPWR
jgi:hypothetical protein